MLSGHESTGIGSVPSRVRLRPAPGDAITEGVVTRGAPLAIRSIRLVGGLALFALGLSLMIRADLGLSAWDVLHDALRSLTPLTFGQVVVVVSVVVLLAGVALGVRPGVGTVANAVLVGLFADAMLATPVFADLATGPAALRFAVMVVGVWGIALGSAFYISARLGAGPRDGLMLGLAMRSGRSAGVARTAIEATVLVVGIALGGSAGLGTAAFVILIGPAIDTSFRMLGMQPTRERKQRLWGRR